MRCRSSVMICTKTIPSLPSVIPSLKRGWRWKSRKQNELHRVGASHACSILFFLATLVVAGVVASFSLPVALFPHVSFPRVRITLDAGDRPAERMAIEVTTPVEEAVRAIPGVRSVRSTTSRGTAEISVNFDWGEDMVAAMLQCQSQVNKILPALPAGTSFEVERMDPTVFPVI